MRMLQPIPQHRQKNLIAMSNKLVFEYTNLLDILILTVTARSKDPLKTRNKFHQGAL